MEPTRKISRTWIVVGAAAAIGVGAGAAAAAPTVMLNDQSTIQPSEFLPSNVDGSAASPPSGESATSSTDTTASAYSAHSSNSADSPDRAGDPTSVPAPQPVSPGQDSGELARQPRLPGQC